MRTTLFPDKKQKSVTARFGRGFENAEREIGETGRRDARVAGRRRRVRRTHHAGGVDGGLQLLHGEGHEGLRATLAALLRKTRGDRRRVRECPESLNPTRAFGAIAGTIARLHGRKRVRRTRASHARVTRYRTCGRRERGGSSSPLGVVEGVRATARASFACTHRATRSAIGPGGGTTGGGGQETALPGELRSAAVVSSVHRARRMSCACGAR